jgi:hypothetical protein
VHVRGGKRDQESASPGQVPGVTLHLSAKQKVHSAMGKKQSDRSKSDLAGTQSVTELMADIPDLTPEQLNWLAEQTSQFEKDYVPTRSLIPGL